MEPKTPWILKGEFTIREVYKANLWGGDLGITAEGDSGEKEKFYSKAEGRKETREAERVGKECLGKRVIIEYSVRHTGLCEYIVDRVFGLNWETPRTYNQILAITPLDESKN